METDVILPAAWADSVGGYVLRDTVGAMRLGVDSGECGRTNDILSDFGYDDCPYNRKCILWQGIA